LEKGALVVKDLESGDQQEVEIESVALWLAARVI
jgi:hypothetical protein